MDDERKPTTVTDSTARLSNEDDPEKQLLIAETILSDVQCLHTKVDAYEDRLQAMEEAHITSMNAMKDHIKEAIASAVASIGEPTTPLATPDQSSSSLGRMSSPPPQSSSSLNSEPSAVASSSISSTPSAAPSQSSSTLGRMVSISPQSNTLSSSRNSINRFRLFLFRGFARPHRTNEPGNQQCDVVDFRLEEDTYSLMMLSKPFGREWALGILTAFIFQIYLGMLVLVNLYQNYRNACDTGGCIPYNVPILAPQIEVTLAQGVTIMLVLATQTDVLTSVYTLSTLWHKSDHVPWDSLIGEEGNRTLRQWNTRIMFPNVLKFIEGAAIIFASFVVIIQSRDVIDLLKDFAALLVISQADNIMFNLACGGYLGEHLSARANRLRKVSIQIRSPVGDSDNSSEDRIDSAKSNCCNAYTVRSLFFFGSCILMIGGWIYIVYGQYSGVFAKMRYPNCDVLSDNDFGDGICQDYPPLNTELCGWDNGDCPAQS